MSEFDNFIEKLKIELAQALPGEKAQLKMSPFNRLVKSHDFNARQSSVLILFYPSNNEIMTVLIVRQIYNGVHSGQISFPGGKFDESDKDLKYTALREANEEIGVLPSDIEIIGQLTKLYIYPSNMNVNPFVGYVRKKPVFIPDHYEVNEILEIPINTISDKKIRLSSN